MWKTFAPIVTGLSLSLAVPAPATEKVEPGKGADRTRRGFPPQLLSAPSPASNSLAAL
jgi:hypothetical protein